MSLEIEEFEIDTDDQSPTCKVALSIETNVPLIHSMELTRTSGNAVSEALLSRMLKRLNLEEVRRLKAGQGFAFFVPGLVDLTRWADLHVLNLNGTGLTQLPEAVGALTSLKELRLSNNRLTTLPRSLGKLVDLKLLIVDHNQLVSIPGNCRFSRQLFHDLL